MKSIITFFALVLFAVNVSAQEGSVAIVRQIYMIAQPENQQRLIVSRPGQEAEIIGLKQRYSNKGMNKEIGEDNQVIIDVFSSLIAEGYELETSSTFSFTAGSVGFSSHSGGREIMYIFVKDE